MIDYCFKHYYCNKQNVNIHTQWLRNLYGVDIFAPYLLNKFTIKTYIFCATVMTQLPFILYFLYIITNKVNLIRMSFNKPLFICILLLIC